MSERANQLHATVDDQLAVLIGLLATLDETTLRLPCPGREKLGDGTIAASTQHTADNYQRIAKFIKTSDKTRGRTADEYRGHRVPRFLRSLGHQPPDHADHRTDEGAGGHDNQYTADNIDLRTLLRRLDTTRETLTQIALPTDPKLQTIPPDGSFRFCDGKRTLDEVIESLFRHQNHQIEAINAAITTAQPGPLSSESLHAGC
jgi:hypothetical protein